MESNRELEMAEITSEVFDILHRTPVSLKQLSAIAVSLEIWRCEINKYRSSNTLEDLRPSVKFESKTVLVPGLASAIDTEMVDKYIEIFGLSLENWLNDHYDPVFEYQYEDENDVLKYFHDFVCDYNGTIHYERTAKRMMNCSELDLCQKFLIACMYCFKDDVRRIYPLALDDIIPQCMYFSSFSLFNYWICVLEGSFLEDEELEEWMFEDFINASKTCLRYIWNLIPSDSQMRQAINFFERDTRFFIRFVLPMLKHQQIDEFLNRKGCEMMYAVLKDIGFDEEDVLSTWIYVKHFIREIDFKNLVMKMLRNEFVGTFVNFDGRRMLIKDDSRNNRDIRSFLHLCGKVWNSAPDNLKHSVVREIASNETLFGDIIKIRPPPTSNEFKFLVAILSYAAEEERNAFWHNCWNRFIKKTQSEDLLEIMNLCLRNEDEVTQFKKKLKLI